jgi:hypothetical protein
VDPIDSTPTIPIKKKATKKERRKRETEKNERNGGEKELGKFRRKYVIVSYSMIRLIACEVPFVEQRTELNEWVGGWMNE